MVEVIITFLFLQGAVCKIFDFMLVKDLVCTCVKKRDGFNRSLVWSCIVCLTLLLITLQGEMTIGYLFASARLGWDVEEYSTYVGASVVLGILGTILGIKLMRQCAGIILTFDNPSRCSYLEKFSIKSL